MNFHPLPEEQENPQLVQHLQEIYEMTPEDHQSLANIEARLLQRATTVEAQTSNGPMSINTATHTKQTNNVSPFNKTKRSKSKRWHSQLTLIAAIFLTLILIAGAIPAFGFIKSRLTNTVTTPSVTVSPTPDSIPTKTVLGNGTRLDAEGLYMATRQIGWAMSGNTLKNRVLYRTEDGGKNWQSLALPPALNGKYFYASVFDKDMIMLFTTTGPAGFMTGEFFRSFDGSKTWQHGHLPQTEESKNPKGQIYYHITFTDHKHGWVNVSQGNASEIIPPAGGQKLFKTNNGGDNWEEVSLPALKYIVFDVTFSDPQNGWLIARKDNPAVSDRFDPHAYLNILYVTRDGGRTWNMQNFPNPSAETNTFVSIGKITFTTPNDGYTFASSSNGSDTQSNQQYMYITHDGGKSWLQQGNELSVSVKSVIDDTHLYVSSLNQDQFEYSLLTLTNNRWQATPVKSFNSQWQNAQFLTPRIGFAIVGYNDIFFTDNSGQTWQKINSIP